VEDDFNPFYFIIFRPAAQGAFGFRKECMGLETHRSLPEEGTLG